MENQTEDTINKIKKVTSTESINRTNKLLSDGWILLAVQKVDSGHPKRTIESVYYHLGHTNPQANMHNGYTKPDELRLQ